MGANILVIPENNKLDVISPSFVKYYNTNHTSLLELEAMLPFIIDNPNEFNKNVYKNFRNILLNFVESKGYLKRDSKGNFIKIEKDLDRNDISLFGLLCYYCIYSYKINTKKSTDNIKSLDLFMEDINDKLPNRFKQVTTPRSEFLQKVKDFRSAGKDVNAIKSSEYSRIMLNFRSEGYKYSVDDKTDIVKACNELVNVLPEEIRKSFNSNNSYQNKTEANNSTEMVFQALLRFFWTTPYSEKLASNKQIYSKLLDYMELLIKSDVKYLLLNTQSLMDTILYKNISDKGLNSILNKNKSSFIQLKNSMVDSNSVLVTLINDIDNYKKQITDYISKLNSFSKPEVTVDTIPEDSINIPKDLFLSQSDFDEYLDMVKILDAKETYDKEKHKLSLFNQFINKAIDEKRKPLIQELQKYHDDFSSLNTELNPKIYQFQKRLSDISAANVGFYFNNIKDLIKAYLNSNNISIFKFDYNNFIEFVYNNQNMSNNAEKKFTDTLYFCKEFFSILDEYNTKFKNLSSNFKNLFQNFNKLDSNIDVMIQHLNALSKSKVSETDEYFDKIVNIDDDTNNINTDKTNKYLEDLNTKTISDARLYADDIVKNRSNSIENDYDALVEKSKDPFRKSNTIFNNFLKNIYAAKKFTVNDFDNVFRFSEYLSIKDDGNVKNGISFIVTLSNILIDYLMLDPQTSTKQSINDAIDDFLELVNKNPSILEVFPVSVTKEYFIKNKAGIQNEVRYLLYNRNLNNIKNNKRSGIIEDILDLMKNLDTIIGEDLNLQSPYTVKGSYDPSQYFTFLQSQLPNELPYKLVNYVNKGTLEICNKLVEMFVEIIQKNVSSESVYLDSIAYLKSKLILDVLNTFPVYTIKQNNVTLHQTDFLNNLLLPKFQSYLLSNKILDVQSCLNYRVNKQYKDTDFFIKMQYANYFTVRSIHALVYDFIKNNNIYEDFFKLDLDDDSMKNRIYLDDLFLKEALKTTGLFTFERGIEKSNTDKLLMLSKIFSLNPEANQKQTKAYIGMRDPFYLWKRTLRNFSLSYKLSTLYYTKLILNDLGCTKDFLNRLDNFQKKILKSADHYSDLVKIFDSISSKYDILVKYADDLVSNLDIIAEDALNYINNDSILSRYVSFNMKSFNLNTGEFEYSINKQLIQNEKSANGLKLNKINQLQIDMHNIVEGLKIVKSSNMSKLPMDNLISRATQIYNIMIDTTSNKNLVTESLVENRVFTLFKKIKLYFAQLEQNFNKFKELCDEIVLHMEDYTSFYEDSVDSVNESGLYNVRFELNKYNNKKYNNE